MNTITGIVLASVLSISTPVSAITIDANASGTADVGGIQVGVTSQTPADNTSTTSDESSASVTVGGDAIVVTADTVAEATITPMLAASVSTAADLNAYAQGVVKTNAEIRDVVLTDTEVAVSHRARARIFGIFPTTVYARTQVMSDGSVTVSYPWYAFASGKKAALESKVKASIESLPSVAADTEAEARFDASTQAAVLEKTVAAMQAQFTAEAAAKAEVN